MAKICLKIVLMFVLTLVWGIGLCAADEFIESCHWLVLICMVLLPMLLFALACRSSRMDDVLDLFEKIEKKMNTY